MLDYLNNKVKVGDIVIGIYGNEKPCELTMQRVTEVHDTFICVERVSKLPTTIKPISRYISKQFIILK